MSFSKKNLIITGIIVLVLVFGIFLTFRSKKTKTTNPITTDTTDTLDFDIESEEVTPIPTIISEPTLTPIPTESQTGISTAIVTKIPTITPTRIPTLTPIPTLKPTLKPTNIPTLTPTPTPDTNIYATGIILNTIELTLKINQSYQVIYRVDPNETTDKTVSWSSSDGNIATVTNDAWITAKNTGETTITARTANNMSTLIKVKVIEDTEDTVVTTTSTETPTEIPTSTPTEPLISYPNKINLNLSRLILPVSQSRQFSVLLQPQNVKNKRITWSVSNGSIATITADGLMTAKTPGTVTLTVTSDNNLTDTATIEVISSSDSVSELLPTQVPTVRPTQIPTPTMVQRLWTFTNYNWENKPFMKCNTYTAADRARLENLLTRAVNTVGRGTRAGVVEAARFLAGGLDYRIPYLGPKKVDSTLGRYDKSGLNIGNSKGWGCGVSGWTQGMDCTNFVRWAITNGGLSWSIVGPQSSAVPLKDNVARVKPGDFLLTLSNGVVAWTYQHTSIVIAVDSNYIYVAEETGSGLIVSKVSKSNPPSKNSNLGMVAFGRYSSEGKLTNMWNQ